jgi:hypothetical protein
MTSYGKNYRNANDDESTITTAVTTGTAVSPPVKQRKRKIRFSLSSNQLFYIPHIADMDGKEVSAIWYQKREYEAIRSKTLPILHKMKKGDKIRESSNKQTVRGLEKRTRLGARHFQKNRTEAVNAVLTEQYDQRCEGVQDDEHLAEVYSNASSQSHDEAYELGLKDEAELEKELKKMRCDTNPLTSSKTLNTSDCKKSRGINSLLKQVGLRRCTLPAIETKKTSVVGSAA